MRRFLAAAPVACLAAATGCSDDDDPQSEGGTDAATEQTVAYPASLSGEGPTTDDHWHMAYGFYLCDPGTGEMRWGALEGNQEILDESGRPIGAEPKYAATGVHSHDDGVIHWHAISSEATGANAQFGLFLDIYDVVLTDSELRLPPDQGGATFSEAETKCGDEPGELSVTVWPDYADTEHSVTVTEGLAGLPMSLDGSVYVVAFAPAGTEIPQPKWAADLPELGAADGG